MKAAGGPSPANPKMTEAAPAFTVSGSRFENCDGDIAPTKSGCKSFMNINKYRDLCRVLVREFKHPDLTSLRKHVLLRLVDYVNSEDFTAWPDFDTLAADLV